MCAKVVK